MLNIPELEKREPLASDMSLRDWFAGQALAGLATRHSYRDIMGVASDAYEYADAMLKEHLK
jgi:hypothetical protein